MNTIRFKIFITVAIWLSGVAYAHAQLDPSKVCRLEKDRLVFTLDSNWTDAEKTEVILRFDLDSMIFAKAFKGIPFLDLNNITWEVKTLKTGQVEISQLKSPNPPAFDFNPNDIFILDFNWITPPPPPDFIQEYYGVNKLKNKQIIQHINGLTRFFLPGNTEVKKVYLSGSFNNWSTMQLPMTRTDSGWISDVKLAPGRYSYKFIIDGRWTSDRSNELKEDDTHGGKNSIFYVYNYTFKLKGFTNAKKVVVSGSFNDWNEKELIMNPVNGGWEFPLFLRQGTHAYKFIVDKQWMLDPDNPVSRPDGRGNENSFIGIGDSAIFRLNGFPEAKKVVLSGSFNEWNQGELFMTKDSSGWHIPYILGAGNYEYKYIVDGRWIIDPDNPFTTGYGDTENSFFPFKANYIFELDSLPEAKQVIVTGSFNAWRTDGYRMKFIDGKWMFPIFLPPGKYTYKFIVDGQWILDPANEIWEGNEYGTGNSVLWIENQIGKE